MVGCTTYECFGAGQHVTRAVYDGASWRDQPDGGQEMFEVFAVVQRLHEMLVLLDQAVTLSPEPDLAGLRTRVSGHTGGRPEDILGVDLDRLTVLVGEALRSVSASVRGDGPSYAGQDLLGRDLRDTDLARADLRGALLIAADLRDAVLDRTDLLGADLRDTDLSGADLSTALFLTQPQLNAARGSAATALPPGLRRPGGWAVATLGATVLRHRLVPRPAPGALALLHLGLVDVPPTLDQLVAGLLLERPERRVVALVVLLDDLEGPAALQHVAAQQVVLDLRGELVVTGVAQQVDGLAQRQVGGARPAVEGVEQPARLLHRLEGLGELAERGDGGVGDAVRSDVLGELLAVLRFVGPVLLGHPRTSVACTLPCSSSTAPASFATSASLTATPDSAKASRSSLSTVLPVAPSW